MQKLLTLAMTITIIYLIVTHSANTVKLPKRPNAEDAPVTQKQANEEINLKGNFVEKTVSNIVHNVLQTEEGKIFFENLIQPMDKPIAAHPSLDLNGEDFLNSLFKITTFGEGDKGPASCGHVVTIDYKILSSNNILIKSGSETIALGSDKIAPGVDAVIVGMKTGQTRHASVATKYFTKDPKHNKSYFKIQVSLKHIVPNNFAEDVKIFDDKITYKLPMVCGMKVAYDAKITKLSNNKVIYDSLKNKQTINMKIGNQKYPMIFSHALHNKIPVGTRTVITPGKHLKSYVSDYSAILPDQKIPDKDMYMIEFSNFTNE